MPFAPAVCQDPLGWSPLRCEHGTEVWFPKRCRACPGCRRARVGTVIARILLGLQQPGDHVLLTLTSRPGTTWPQIMKAWSSMVRGLRQGGSRLPYAAIKQEGRASGMKHLHIVALGWSYVPQRELSRRWLGLTGAPVVDVRRIEDASITNYLAPYLASDLAGTRKNVTYSLRWPKLPRGHTWQLIPDRHPIAICGNVAEVTTRGCAVVKWGKGCDCLDPQYVSDPEFTLWRRSTLAHWHPASRAPWGT
ncbi:hypothetical protein LCGC14_1650610 [marine sediment metagenome]|uniref:Replication protein n=1 Tax=marine sediment metagenome TaxID=412755 RepID=A0A0F9IJF0_9ZZZZ